MSRSPEIVRYRGEHKESVAQLQTVLWGPDVDRNARYFEWKYERNPWAVEPRVYLALRGGRVVGMRGFYESRWRLGSGSQSVSIPLADDHAIASGDRNSGLVAHLMRAALADLRNSGFDYVLSLSAGIITMLGSLALGWKSAGRHEVVARRASRWRARLRDRVRRSPFLWRWAEMPVLHARTEREPYRALDAASALGSVRVERRARPDAMARLVADLDRDRRLRHVRSREYLAWRFANPHHEYRFLYSGEDDRLDGYLVLGSRTGDSPPSGRVWIADLEGRDARIRSELISRAVEAGRFAELMTWRASLGAGEQRLLQERGFAPADPEREARGCPCLLVRSTHDRPASEWAIGSLPLLERASWDLRMLDSMAG